MFCLSPISCFLVFVPGVSPPAWFSDEGREGQVADVEDADLLPLEPTQLSWWAKLWELQSKMFLSKQDTELEHKYSSQPSEWPFMARNIAYWMSPTSNVSTFCCQAQL